MPIHHKAMDKEELHKRLMILKEELEKGRIKFAPGLKVIESLKKVRYDTNGKVDPSTVDSILVTLANVVAFKRNREQLKAVPLIDVQRTYFKILERFFSKPFSEMKKHNLDPHNVAAQMAAKPKMVAAFKVDASELASGIREFWDQYAPVVKAHLEDMQVLKAVFGGDIFPSHSRNIACSSGLYLDTIILPDPFLRVSKLFDAMKTQDTFYYLVKHALNALQYKQLALAEIHPPIVCIAPNYSMQDEQALSYLVNVGTSDLLVHCSKIFGRKFDDEKQLDKFLGKITSVDDLSNSVVEPDRFLFDTEWKNNTVRDKFMSYRKEILSRYVPGVLPEAIGVNVKMAILGRMMQINDVLFESQQYSGSPIIDAPTSWQYFVWKYEYDRVRSDAVNPGLKSTLLAHALHAGASNELPLLSRIPPSVLIDLRRHGAMEDLRRILSKGLQEISSADQFTFREVADNVTSNLENAFEKHKRKLDDLTARKRKFFGFDITPWIVTGGISIAAASTGNIPLSILAASLALVGTPSAKDLWKNGKKILETEHQIKKSPIGILFKVK